MHRKLGVDPKTSKSELQRRLPVRKSFFSIWSPADAGKSAAIGSSCRACLISRQETDARSLWAYTCRWATRCLETKVSIVFQESVAIQQAAGMLACSRSIVGERRYKRLIADVLKIRVSKSKTELVLELGLGQEPEPEVEPEMQWMRAYSRRTAVHGLHQGGN